MSKTLRIFFFVSVYNDDDLKSCFSLAYVVAIRES